MISQLNQNHLFLFVPATHQKSPATQNPSAFSLKVSNFRGSKSTHLQVHCTQSSNSERRLSRFVRAKVEDVLLDYLYSNRGYSFVDAEFISKNSPHFVQGLVTELKLHGQGGDDVVGALRKFLRYNPINEFEPFFESLGISPHELPLFLPRDMIYLSDDDVLLENFHDLTNCGVPRNRIGKILKEAKEVFGYPSGLLSSKFRAYEDLGLSRSTIVKLVVCCPSLLIGETSSELVVVLDWLERIGIERDWIGNYLSCSKTYNMKKMLDAMQFLHKVGWSEKQMHNLFKEYPALLLEGLGKKVYVFLGLSLKLGVKENVIYSSFIEYPYILSSKCAQNLLRVVGFLYYIEMGTDDIAHILSSHMHHLSSHPLKGPKAVCNQLKIKRVELHQIIKDDPLKLINLASKLKQNSGVQLPCDDPSKHLDKTTFLLKLGYVVNSEEMEKAVKRFRGRGDQLQERFDCLVGAGLDYDITIKMVKRAPMILNQNKVVIEKKIDFLRNILGYPLESVVVFPAYLCYNLEKIMLRFSMYAWLRERKAANPMLTLSTILASSEERFVKEFVNVHPEGPIIWKGLKNLSQKNKI